MTGTVLATAAGVVVGVACVAVLAFLLSQVIATTPKAKTAETPATDPRGTPHKCDACDKVLPTRQAGEDHIDEQHNLRLQGREADAVLTPMPEGTV